MSDVIDGLVERAYAYGFHADFDMDLAPKGLNEDVVRLISAKKNEPEWLLEWRLSAFATSSPSTSRRGRTWTVTTDWRRLPR